MFISFEGTEGVGKTTLIRRIHDYFTAQGQVGGLTREPGGTPMAEQIRALLLAVNHEEKMCSDTEVIVDVCSACPAFRSGDFTCVGCRKNCAM